MSSSAGQRQHQHIILKPVKPTLSFKLPKGFLYIRIMLHARCMCNAFRFQHSGNGLSVRLFQLHLKGEPATRRDWRRKTLIAVVRYIPNSPYKLSHCLLMSLSIRTLKFVVDTIIPTPFAFHCTYITRNLQYKINSTDRKIIFTMYHIIIQNPILFFTVLLSNYFRQIYSIFKVLELITTGHVMYINQNLSV